MISLGENHAWDELEIAPFGKVVSGMSTLEELHRPVIKVYTYILRVCVRVLSTHDDVFVFSCIFTTGVCKICSYVQQNVCDVLHSDSDCLHTENVWPSLFIYVYNYIYVHYTYTCI